MSSLVVEEAVEMADDEPTICPKPRPTVCPDLNVAGAEEEEAVSVDDLRTS